MSPGPEAPVIGRDERASADHAPDVWPGSSTPGIPGREKMMGLRKPLWAIILILAATAAISGCSGGPVRHGTVTGVFVMVGGPGPGVSVRLPGRVIAPSTAGQRFPVTVSMSGRFTIYVPPGTYQLTGYSPRVHVNHAEMRCVAARAVHVRVGQPTRGNVYCSVP